MFELSIAWKYLLPKRRQLSVSIISLISIVVISLVVWLILVFFSVTSGLEKGWVEKLITLTSPVRITPTDAYYRSYYYQIDHYSNSSDYAFKSIGEKKNVLITDPYNEEEDEELPSSFPKKDTVAGKQKDLVKLAFEAIQAIPSLSAHDYEVTSANLRLRLVRGQEKPLDATQSFLSQAVYLGTFEETNPAIKKILVAHSHADEKNTLALNSWEKPETGSYAVLAPKSFRDAGVLLGDRGSITYLAPTASSLQEQRLPIHVSGFYDPGIVPLGGKFLLASPELVRTVRSSQAQDSAPMTNGINIRFPSFKEAESVKERLNQEFEARGITPYWKIETYRDFDYAKDLLQQLSSEKNIFSLISAVIIIVACSNIISMLIILVNDKRTEIGVLRSMGASSASIALIFGISGAIMGLAGTLIGSGLAYLTLQNLSTLLSFISRVQGFDAFNPVFYGDHLPNTMSSEAFFIVLGATGVISLFAGLIPAIKASQVKPACILRSE